MKKIDEITWLRLNKNIIKSYLFAPSIREIEHLKLKNSAGVYLISLVRDNKEIFPAYVGESNNLYKRIAQHLHNFFGTEASNMKIKDLIGIEPKEFGRIKLAIRIIHQDIQDAQIRLNLEECAIKKYKPYTQCLSYPKPNGTYTRSDLCICREFRRQAYLDTMGIPLWYDVLISDAGIDWRTQDLKRKPKSEIIEKISDEVLVQSNEFFILKKTIDTAYGYSKQSRGCTQNFVYKLIANAVENYSLID